MAELLAGRLYWVASTDPYHLRLLASGTLLGNGGAGLVSEGDAGSYLVGEARREWRLGRIPALSVCRGGAYSGIRRLKRFLAELEHFGFARLDLLVIDPGVEALDLMDARQTGEEIMALQAWAHRHGCAILLLFPGLLEETDSLVHLLSHADRFAGTARIQGTEGEPVWQSGHWFWKGGFRCPSQDVLLRIRDEGLIAEGPEIDPVMVEPLPAADDALVYATADAVGDAPALPRGWTAYASASELADATQQARGATLILDYGVHTDIEELGHLISRIRRRNGNAIKLIVRERGAVIRHYQEHLLIDLGCNLVVPNGVGFIRLVSLIESLSGQVCSRPGRKDLKALDHSRKISVETGYLPLQRFVEVARKTLDESSQTAVESVLLEFSMLPGLVPLDGLRELRLKRAGDICTADDYNVYLLLFACRESDIPVALQNIVRLPVAQLFADQVRFLTREVIRGRLDGLERRAARAPDYTEALRETWGDEPRQEGADGLSAERVDAFASDPPPDAIPEPLGLRAN